MATQYKITDTGKEFIIKRKFGKVAALIPYNGHFLDRARDVAEECCVALNNAEARPTVLRKPPVQQRKGKIVRGCHTCGTLGCENADRCYSTNGKYWSPRTASPVA
jgi:hypothetical protein